MRIRTRLLLLLLAFSLLPLLALRLMNQSAVLDMSQEIADQVGARLVQRAGMALEQQAEGHAFVLMRERQLLELALRVQAELLERAIAERARNSVGGAPPRGEPVLSERHCLLRPSGLCPQEPVHYDRWRFFQGEDSPVAEQLLSLAPELRELSRRFPGLFLWQFAWLHEGVEAVFPDTGLMPRSMQGMHAHRTREAVSMAAIPSWRSWHDRALEAGEPVWSKPGVDPLTGKLTITVSMPLRRYGEQGAGEMVGSTAIVVEMSAMLRAEGHHRDVSEKVDYLVVEPGLAPDGKQGLRVLARVGTVGETPQRGGRRRHMWFAQTEEQWVRFGTPEVVERITEDIREGRPGVWELEYRGEPSLAAHGNMGTGGSALMLVVPKVDATRDAESAQTFVRERIRREMINSGLLVVGVLLAVTAIAVILSRRFTRRIEALAGGFTLVSKGDFSVRLPVDTRDEIGALARGFNAMVPALEERIRMRQSLEVAHEIQQSFLPARAPEVPGLDLAGISNYSESTGGDYFDFMPCEQGGGRMALAVGDVTGHGLPAALLMTTARALLRQRFSMPGGPARVVADVNTQLFRDVDQTGRFMTLFFAVWDSATRELAWCRAGHDPALLLEPGGEFSELQGQGLPLGTVGHWQYEEQRRVLAPGSLLCIGTDGVWETQNLARELYGKERLRAVLRANAHLPVREIIQAVLEDLERFRESAPQEDDVTLVLLKVKPRDGDVGG
jgi:phosphoserine phosphatase RsbU/P